MSPKRCGICHVNLQLLIWLHVSDFIIFGMMKDDDCLLIHNLASFDSFTHRNLFQNGANSMSEMVNMGNDFFCQKAPTFVQFRSSDFFF